MLKHLRGKFVAVGPLTPVVLRDLSGTAAPLRADIFRVAGRRQPDSRLDGQADRLAIDRPALYGGRVFPARALRPSRTTRPRREPRTGEPTTTCCATASPGNWGRSSSTAAEPTRASLWPPTSKPGSRRTARTESPALSPNGPPPIRPSRRTGSKPILPTAAYVTAWQSTHADDVARWIKQNPDTPQPKPEDLAVDFFTELLARAPRHLSRSRRAQIGWTAKRKNASNRSRKGPTSKRPSSTSGVRSMLTPISNRCRPTW